MTIFNDVFLDTSSKEFKTETHTLPKPSKEALDHSNQLLDYLRWEIQKSNQGITFEKYMNIVLHSYPFGYYHTNLEKFGEKGDFMTGPEISPLYSYCIARQLQEILNAIPNSNILEIGAGTGQMAADILLELEKLNSLPNYYFILELSSELQQRSKEKIQKICPKHFKRIVWLDTLENFSFNGIIIANEVLDAMPCLRFDYYCNQFYRHHVLEKNGQLTLESFITHQKELVKLKPFFEKQLSNSKKPYTSEINLNIQPWILSLSKILNQGIMLFIDYGFSQDEYYHPDREMGTLMCHYRHYAHHNPLLYPGLQDITAHVNFTAVANAALKANLEILGFTNQSNFLLANDLIEIASQQKQNSPLKILHRNQSIHQLTSPAEMGELFKVIALAKNYHGSLRGFSLKDFRYQL